MINPSLDLFAATLIEAARIRSGDVKRLQRDILPDGISSRAEAELLLRLDQSVRRADPAFSAWLVAAMADFVVWGSRPTGVVTAEATRWLAAALDAADLTETALHIAYAVVEEAHDLDEALLTFILRRRQYARRLQGRVPPSGAGKPPLPVGLKVL